MPSGHLKAHQQNKAMSLSPKDMDFIEARHGAAREIALALGVPPMLLGIPGDNVTAILLGAFVAQGLRPGPQLFEEQGATVFAILVAMVFANLLFLLIGYLSIPIFSPFPSFSSCHEFSP